MEASDRRATRSVRSRLWSLPAWHFAFPAALVSRLGDYVFDTTVVLWIATRIANGKTWAPLAVGGVLVAAALPVLLAGPIAGVVNDRFDRRRILLCSNLIQAGSIASLLLVPVYSASLGTAGELVWIYVSIAVANAAGQFFGIARMAMIQRTIPDELRTTAFADQGAANQILAILGPPLAAPLLFAAGVGWALGLNAASFVVSAFLLARVRWEGAPPPTPVREAMWGSLRSGAAVVAGNPVLRAITIAITVATLGTGGLNVLEVFFVTEVLHERAQLLGILMMCAAAGMVIGALSAPVVERRFGAARVVVVGMIATGAAIVVYSRLTGFLAACVVYFVIALPLGAVNTVVTPLWMRSVSAELLGRSIAFFQMLPAFASLVAMGGTGWLASTVLAGIDFRFAGSHFGPVDTVFFVAGALIVIAGMLVWRPLQRATSKKSRSANSQFSEPDSWPVVASSDG
ncbi:MFS transporter [Rudaeicoccus suwonensis]|uniref:MFS transporter n=1 Tax=Rudaeicoccus suwonensis TaxID=657409 RepID=A0A561E917_9MICO|nr:MFS transporter [Rudaeicoccus suwonensis]TWE12077.1 MFS transporter [Rudaeicoccus suwonensis]